MDDQHKQLELEDERTAQKRYRQKVQEQARRPMSYTAPANTIFTQDARPRVPNVPEGHLIGRIALVTPQTILGDRSDFYIGDRHITMDGVEVFSWAAPVSCTYFRGTNHHDWCEDVAVVRSFEHDGDRISDLVDDVLRDDAPATPFAKRGLAIPAAPDRPGRRRPGAATPRRREPTPSASSEPTPPTPTEATVPPPPEGGHEQVSSTEPAHHSPPPARVGAPAPAIRAESLLRSRLQAPRTKSLAPVLSTLQPDQYTLVTIPAMDSVIIEGQPGTGKTIVATHRAAYLINDETPKENTLDGNVLLLGPTNGYSAHVRDVVNRLTADSPRVLVMSMPELMRQILDLRQQPKGPSTRDWQDVDIQLGILARSAITRLRTATGMTPTSKEVFEYLRTMGADNLPPHQIPDWANYLQTLPPYEKALATRAHTPLLAFIRWEVAKPRHLEGIEHIIVDEAQDVHPLEWMLLTAINEADAWTLLGDLNQRRSDHTLGSWRLLSDILSVPYGDPKVHRLERGYRSTKPILEYANRLLPRAERALLAFQQEGPEPVVRKVRPHAVEDMVLDEIERLHTAYPSGTVAVIAVEPHSVRARLRVAGWKADLGNPMVWEKAGRHVTVVHPDAARGLEFDAVVVTEPSAFPKNFGRRGPLYTALTRPNRELVIVHSTPLPEELRDRKRS